MEKKNNHQQELMVVLRVSAKSREIEEREREGEIREWWHTWESSPSLFRLSSIFLAVHSPSPNTSHLLVSKFLLNFSRFHSKVFSFWDFRNDPPFISYSTTLFDVN